MLKAVTAKIGFSQLQMLLFNYFERKTCFEKFFSYVPCILNIDDS